MRRKPASRPEHPAGRPESAGSGEVLEPAVLILLLIFGLTTAGFILALAARL